MVAILPNVTPIREDPRWLALQKWLDENTSCAIYDEMTIEQVTSLRDRLRHGIPVTHRFDQGLLDEVLGSQPLAAQAPLAIAV